MKGRQGKAVKVLGELQLRRCNSSKIPSAAGKFPVFLTSEGIILTLQRTKKTLVRPHLGMQHKLPVQSWCASARATLLLLETPSAYQQLGGFHGISDAAVYLCSFNHEHFIDCGNVSSQHVGEYKHPYFNAGDS